MSQITSPPTKEFVSEIVATGYAYPSLRVSGADFLARCRFDLAADPAVLARETGIETRAWCADGENTLTMARDAVAMALVDDPTLLEQLDLVIVASGTTMPVLHPADPEEPGMADLAPLLLRTLGRDRAIGLDIKACYCTGFLRGLQLADAMIQAGQARVALVVATEQGSRFSVADTNRSTFCFIMGDAAGAAILRRRPRATRTGVVDAVGYTAASKFDWAGIGPDGQSTIMRGARAGEATHAMLVECASALLDRNRLRQDQVDWLLPIQTHAGIVEGVRAALSWPKEKLLWNASQVGFSGSASIPSCLAERRAAGFVRKGDLVLSIAVGAGMNCAGALWYC